MHSIQIFFAQSRMTLLPSLQLHRGAGFSSSLCPSSPTAHQKPWQHFAVWAGLPNDLMGMIEINCGNIQSVKRCKTEVQVFLFLAVSWKDMKGHLGSIFWKGPASEAKLQLLSCSFRNLMDGTRGSTHSVSAEPQKTAAMLSTLRTPHIFGNF